MVMKMRTTIAIALASLAIGIGAGAAVAQGYQPHMQNALASLQTAKAELQLADPDKGGHRVNAINLVNQAITEVQAGVAVGAGM
jgi:hypothetical protein